MSPSLRAFVTVTSLCAACSGSGSTSADSLGSTRGDAGNGPDGPSAQVADDDGGSASVDTPPDRPAEAGADAGEPSPDDDAGDAPALSGEPDRLITTLPEQAELDALAALAAQPISADERASADATAFVEQAAGSAVDAPLPSEAHGGRTAWVRLSWGFIVGQTPPAEPTWHDFAGSIAVSYGELSLLTTVSTPGPNEPAAARPEADVVAPQTDPRVLRFSSQIGSGTGSLYFLLTRPSLGPSTVAITVAGTTHLLPFERFLRDSSEAGGWDIPTGQVVIDTSVIRRTPVCYLETARGSGAVAYGGGSGSPLAAVTGTLTPTGGADEALQLSAQGTPVGAYGGLSGALAAGTLSAYYGREWLFTTFTRRGMIVGALPAASSDDALPLLLADYQGTELVGARVVQQVDCATSGASHDTPFVF
jgi:hypothetical protein